MSTKRNVYKSCNCGWCRGVPSKVKGEHKREAHRAFRRKSKEALRREDEDLPVVSTGYRQ